MSDWKMRVDYLDNYYEQAELNAHNLEDFTKKYCEKKRKYEYLVESNYGF